LFKEAI